MKADEFKVTTVLTWKQRFIVPLYQRQYQWHDARDGNRTAAFWRDVAAKAADVIEGRARFEHYMGALLLAPSAAPQAFGTTPQMQVVDGQQRLTTFLILIAAIREEARTRGFEELVAQCDAHLFTTPGPTEKDPLVKYKLTPTPVDRDLFIAILEGPTRKVRSKFAGHYWGVGVPKNTKFRALRAYEYFLAQVHDFAKSGPADDTDIDIDAAPEQDSRKSDEPSDTAAIQIRLSALLEALVFHLKLIVITLGEEDDAQVIFETLNSAGQPLLAMDLVRNNIFHRAEAQYYGRENSRELAEQLYHQVWEPFDDGWWREQAPNARPNRPRIDHFLSHVLTAETGDRTTVRELYAEYRAWATPKGRPRFEAVEDELETLERYAPVYETLEGRRNEDPAIAWLGDRLRLWQNTTAYPIAFLIASPEVPLAERWAMARLVDSYLTRRAICDLTPKNLNQIFPRVAGSLRNNGVAVSSLRSFFSDLFGPAVRFPTDADVRNGVTESRVYGRLPSRILTEILWQIELKSRTSKTEATIRPAQLWVEHVMPQSWKTNWPLLDDDSSPISADDPRYWAREGAIHTLGNLTIVTSSLNISLANSGFEDKKKALLQHSNLTINRILAEKSAWNEEAIRERGRQIADMVCEIWPSI